MLTIRQSPFDLFERLEQQLATAERVPFVDVFASSQRWFTSSDCALTLDGFQLNEKGNRLLAHQVAETLFGAQAPHNRDMEGVREAVMEKNWMWHHTDQNVHARSHLLEYIGCHVVLALN